MLKVIFVGEDKEFTREMGRDEIEVLQIYKPMLDFEGDGWKIIELRYDVEAGHFRFWIEKQ